MKHTLLLAPFLLTTFLAAQRVVIVDANNGSGTTYTTLDAAFANLLDNDYIVVRAGTYLGSTVTTGLDFVMVGEGNPVVEPVPGSGAALTVTMNGSSYQRIAFRGLTFHGLTTGQWALKIRTNYAYWPSPSANVEDCTILSLSPVQSRVGLSAQSIGLTVQNSTLDTTQVSSCLATFVGCTIHGHDQSLSGLSNQNAETALDVSRSEVWIVDSTLIAGNSHGVYGGPASCLGFSESDYTVTSKVHVAGNSVLQADQSPNAQWQAPFVFRNYQTWWPVPSSIDYEPTVTLVPTPLGPVASTNLTVVTQTVRTLSASDTPLGGAWTCTAHGVTGDVAILLASTASRGNNLLGMPNLMDTSAAVILDYGVVGGTGSGSWAFAPIAMPNNPALRSVVMQASSLFLMANGALAASNPVSGVLH